jgi:hypothetical protein
VRSSTQSVGNLQDRKATRRGALRTEKLVLQDHDDDKHPEGRQQ